MKLSPQTLEVLWHDHDAREVRLREIVGGRLAEKPPQVLDNHVVATYFLALRTSTLGEAAGEIAYHATSGVRNPPPGSLLAECTAQAVATDAFDNGGRIGLLSMAFPLKMLRQADGHVTACDLLHTVAGAIIFDVYENQDARLVSLELPEQVIRTFDGPAHGPAGVRKLAGFGPKEPAFGTILKPTAGITPQDVGRLVGEAAECPLFLFVKEDENLYPNLDYSPVADRTRAAMAAVERARARREGRGLIFAPHVTGSPDELLDTVGAALEAGATGLMFSETFAGGAVRMVRRATRHLANPPAIYGHNAGIGVKTRGIWREVIDLLARLEGIDFRQTAPIKPGPPFIRPYGAEWQASEHALSRPLPGIKPAMIARAGGLDQGNIGLNLAHAERLGIAENLLFLAGSAINSIKNAQGAADPRLGAAAMSEALEAYRSRELIDVPAEEHVAALKDLAARRGFKALAEALRQRYGKG
ncbi:MAG: RuBisCO large subunit C-terminal-like domain-containing protein [Pirellulales bacterium]